MTKAHAEGLTTAGAKSGGQIAQFLLGPDGKPATEADRVLNQLMAPAAEAAPAATTGPAGTAAPAAPAAEPANAVLDQLTKPEPTPAAKPSAAPAAPPEEKPDNDLLQSLLGQPPAEGDKTNRSN
ncbi:MAG: hypothetical protein NTW19_24265 [Planctomycetota bacterium]|nr:hypothetical protein [Planctomycetota bacterium]